MALDFSTDLGAKVLQRLDEDHVVWLTTVAGSGTPQPNLVWFLWNGEIITVYTTPEAVRLNNILRNPRVSLNFNSDPEGHGMIVITGSAEIIDGAPKAIDNQPYLDKYKDGIKGLGMSAQQMSDQYSVVIRITPDHFRGF